MIASYYRGRI